MGAARVPGAPANGTIHALWGLRPSRRRPAAYTQHMQSAAPPVRARAHAPLTQPHRRYIRCCVVRPRHARRPNPLLHRSTSPNAVVYSWRTRQLLGHPRGLVGVSEVEFLELRKEAQSTGEILETGIPPYTASRGFDDVLTTTSSRRESAERFESTEKRRSD